MDCSSMHDPMNSFQGLLLTIVVMVVGGIIVAQLFEIIGLLQKRGRNGD